jgi:hypothetical protein
MTTAVSAVLSRGKRDALGSRIFLSFCGILKKVLTEAEVATG